jgi:hypothetical protein
MTGSELNTLINFKTGADDTTFTPAEKLPLVNIFKNEIAAKIVEKNAGYFLIPVVFDLIASSTSREYAFPSDILNRIKKLELKFSANDARFPSTYLKDYQGSETESEIVANFGNSKGQFAHTIRRRAVLILSGTITALVGGGRYLYYAYPVDLVNLTGNTDLSIDPSITSFGFPKGFHELLARRVSMEWKGAQPKPIPLNATELNYEIDLKNALDALTHQDESAEIIGNSLPDSETGHNGWDY